MEDMLIFVMVGFFAGIILLGWMMGPEARAVTKAKARKRPLLIIPRTDHRVDFKCVDKVGDEEWEIKKYGTFKTEPEAINISRGSNIPMGISYAAVGSVTRPSVIAYLSELAKRGVRTFQRGEEEAERKLEGKEKRKTDVMIAGKLYSWQIFRDYLPIAFNPRFIWNAIVGGTRARETRGEPWSPQKIVAIGVMALVLVVALVILFETDIFNFW